MRQGGGWGEHARLHAVCTFCHSLKIRAKEGSVKGTSGAPTSTHFPSRFIMPISGTRSCGADTVLMMPSRLSLAAWSRHRHTHGVRDGGWEQGEGGL